LSFDINFHETSLSNINPPAFVKIYNVSRTIFMKVYIEMTTNVWFLLSHDFSASTDLSLDTFS